MIATTTPQWKRGVPNADYHADNGVSSTQLKDVATKTPAHALARRNGEQKDTPALVFGDALHVAVLEPDRYPTSHMRGPDGDGRSKQAKEARAALAADHPDATILPPAVFDAVEQIAAKVREHPRFESLLTGGQAETSGYWTDEETGLACRIRPDYMHPASPLLVDLKTTLDASPKGFQRALTTYGYHIQAAFYLDGFEAIEACPCRDFVFVAVEKTPPYAVAIYRLDDAAVEYGRRQYRRALRTIADCIESGTWPAYSDDVEPITLPEWAYHLENLTDEDQ